MSSYCLFKYMCNTLCISTMHCRFKLKFYFLKIKWSPSYKHLVNKTTVKSTAQLKHYFKFLWERSVYSCRRTEQKTFFKSLFVSPTHQRALRLGHVGQSLSAALPRLRNSFILSLRGQTRSPFGLFEMTSETAQMSALWLIFRRHQTSAVFCPSPERNGSVLLQNVLITFSTRQRAARNVWLALTSCCPRNLSSEVFPLGN